MSDVPRFSSGQIGRSLPRLESRAKVTGTAEYIHNLRLPGMHTPLEPHVALADARDGSATIYSWRAAYAFMMGLCGWTVINPTRLSVM
jgi:CO/xanthine dehydrogenase Mo-binding subunit